MKRALWFVMAALPLTSLDCDKSQPQPVTPPRFEPSLPTMPRLTSVQYRNTLTDVFGGVLPQTALEPDQNPYLFYSIGAASTSLSAQGTQQYADSAAVIVDALFSNAKRRSELLGCTPKDASDPCVSGFVKRVGRLLFRRPLRDEDLSRWLGVVSATADGDVYRGLRLTLYGMLQSPRFLYRVELGEDDPAASSDLPRRRYDSFEMAERLSFLLWNTSPDDELLKAAERGELLDDASLEAQTRRLLESPRAREAVQSFFDQYFDLGALSQVERDPKLFPKFSKTLLQAMRSEVQLLVDDAVFRRDEDIRGVFSTRHTFVNRELAELYQVEAPGASEVAFAPVDLPSAGARAGVLTLGAVMTMNAHPTDTSPTRRGKYLRERVLCLMVPPPPPDIPALPQPMGEAPKTVRDRLEEHRKNPACYSCHAMTDPPGFLFENFDPIGAFRTTSQGMPLNTQAEVEGEPMADARDLAARLAFDPRVASCLVKQVFRHASARIDGAGDEPALNSLTARFADSGYRFRELLVALVQSEAFRTAAKEVTP